MDNQSEKIDAATQLIKAFLETGDSFSMAKRKALEHVDLTGVQERLMMESTDYLATRSAFMRQHSLNRRWVKD